VLIISNSDNYVVAEEYWCNWSSILKFEIGNSILLKKLTRI
jgi:hypothetical protein